MTMNEFLHIVKFLIFFPFASGFNLDVERAIVYQGPQGSYYGATTEKLRRIPKPYFKINNFQQKANKIHTWNFGFW